MPRVGGTRKFFSLSSVEKLIRVEDESNQALFFGRRLPTVFGEQSFVSEFLGLDLSTQSKLEVEMDNSSRSDKLMEVLVYLYGCLYFDTENASAISEFCKSLLYAIGFTNLPNVFVYGPLTLCKEIPLGKGKGVGEVVFPDAVVTSSRRIILVTRAGKDPDLLEESIVSDLVAAYVRGMNSREEGPWDVYGIVAIGANLTFYCLRMDFHAYCKLARWVDDLETEFRKEKRRKIILSGEGDEEDSEEGSTVLQEGVLEMEDDNPAVVIKRFRPRDAAVPSFVDASAKQMYTSLRCLEAIRLLVKANKLG